MNAATSSKFLLKTPQPEEATTPLMTQYLTIKQEHPNALLFFRLGDFYELFFEDAIKASKALDIALTRRSQMNGKDVPMCGVPFHAYENYMARLIRQGFHVAICEQTENPAEAKKRGGKSIVSRDVVRIVTPGTVTEETLLETRDANILACLSPVQNKIGIAWIDLATGKPYTQSLSQTDLSSILARLNPSEIILPDNLGQQANLFETWAGWRKKLTFLPDSRFNSQNARKNVLAAYNVKETDAFGDFSREEIAALGSLIDYINLTHKTDLSFLEKPTTFKDEYTIIDSATRQNLELGKTLNGEKQGSLLHAIDRTKTGGGARMLSQRLHAPLMDKGKILDRLNAVEFFTKNKPLRESIQNSLKQTPDLERALARLSLERGGPRDLLSLKDALEQATLIKRELLKIEPASLSKEIEDMLKKLSDQSTLIDRLDRAIIESPPLLIRDGGFIKAGFAPHLDELTILRDDNKRLIISLQQKYAQIAGVPALKIKHNNVIGYFLETTPMHADKLLNKKDVFIHRQTMANSVRFTTIDLSELEKKISEAAGKALAIELQLFGDLVQETLTYLPDLRKIATALAEIDVASSLAELAIDENYTKPIVDDSLAFDIEGGRHPVVEQALSKNTDSDGAFIANKCNLHPDQHLWLLTGPNMAGKSTFLRQNALIALLAQMGSFVPAQKAHIGIIDRLFSRVGAADDLARGRSTFMVEMVETAAILNQATERSLVILDEIGRGTSTYDGLSIAWATIEHLHEVNKSRTLFATHYHELTALNEKLTNLYCATVRIKEWKNQVIFLHEVIQGIADRSYGIHVAQMAGIPEAVIARATSILNRLENEKNKEAPLAKLEDLPLFNPTIQKTESPTKHQIDPELDSTLKNINPDSLTPREALDLLYKIQNLVDKNG